MTPTEATEIWDLAYTFWPKEATFRFFSRHPGTGKVFGLAIRSPQELSNATEWADRTGQNSYWQPNATTKINGTRCSAVDIAQWNYFMVDIDPTTPDANPTEFAGLVERELMSITHNIPKCHRIFSGRGVQLLYPIDPLVVEPYTPLWRAIPRAGAFWLDKINSDVGDKFGCIIDTSCSDLPRVMRLPYTINQKTGRRATILSKTTHTNPKLSGALLQGAPSSIWDEPPPVEPKQVGGWPELLPYLTFGARKFLTEGAEMLSRHKAATSAMLSLMEHGATQEQVLSALAFGAHLCDPPLAVSEVEDMVRRKFQKPLDFSSPK